ncbi:NAD(P)-dependent dehydrogenase (short-subunit alcohol dehydrogenase family) [Paenochrobactrum gallinarii]|uniref:NAD(P)-dependent dehydrogenase (Short-subunit alcohol dehydrogenase family) n=1 Tax=Paenochrobactrum gallinarii TaxID=643673 RepID=A0A841LTV3_9HYPH|nr:SDR family oxidoreductase [Paenochrobactrum gallinarii]MBB6259982.1 NAD(P)-dependent dehydrogenase (short-subunit alcohol dehydrogenase family) [Paenochrobactrum gallinarii]
MAGSELFSVKDKVIVVTGGSSGIGQRIVTLLAEHGAYVVCVGFTQDEPEFCSDRVYYVTADVTRQEDVTRIFDEAEAEFGVVDVVFNNAGVAHQARAIDTSYDMLTHIFNVNVAGAFMVAQTAAKRMIAAKKAGVIINTTSILAERVQKGAAAYSMSKAAISQMTRALAVEWASNSIRVNALAPGWFPTGINSDLLNGPAAGFLKAQNPMRRLGELCDLDGAVLMLASDASAYMTGAIITIDGGHNL